MTRDARTLRRRRLSAAVLLEKGLTQAEIARRLGVSREAVRQWARTLAEGGRDGLRRSTRPGRKPLLSEEDLHRIERALLEGPEQLGLEGDSWTSRLVTLLIERLCGVRYHPAHVSRLLQRLGWKFQRDSTNGWTRDELELASDASDVRPAARHQADHPGDGTDVVLALGLDDDGVPLGVEVEAGGKA